MKILEVNGHKYSREAFDGFVMRVKVELCTDLLDHLVDIYTTDTNINSVKSVLLNKVSDKVTKVNIIHKATKEQDEATAKLIDELITTVAENG